MLYFNKFLPHLWSHLFQILSVQKSEFLSRAVGVTESQTSMKCQETGSCWTSSSNLPHYKCIVSHRPPKIWAFVPEFQPWMMLNYPFLPLFCKMGWTQSLLFFCWVSRSARSSPLDAEFSSFFIFYFQEWAGRSLFRPFVEHVLQLSQICLAAMSCPNVKRQQMLYHVAWTLCFVSHFTYLTYLNTPPPWTLMWGLFFFIFTSL